jgi:acyl carrier protein
MTSSRLPYPWKVVVAAAVSALLIVATMEMRRRWPRSIPVVASSAADATSGLYKDTLARVQEIIAVHTSSVPEVATADMSLVDLGVDPLTRVEIAEALESAYRIRLTGEELAQTVTVDDLVRLVVKQQQGAGSSKPP